MSSRDADVVVIGAGPAGQQAALRAAEAGRHTVLVDRIARPGGECVLRGTIPSKTLQATAAAIAQLRRTARDVYDLGLRDEIPISALMRRVGDVVRAHQDFMARQLERAAVDFVAGSARFLASDRIRVERPGRDPLVLRARGVVIATGSRPRNPRGLGIDHEHVFDSDSLLSMTWAPRSLAVVGGGVIACEYASIMAQIGVEVTLLDRGPRPLAFLDPELTERFLHAFAERGGRHLGSVSIEAMGFDGIDSVRIALEDGREIVAEKALVALGRQASVRGLDLAAAGVEIDERGLVRVDPDFRTAAPGVYAVGDVVGPPGLAAAAVEQGRHAVRHMLGYEVGELGATIPTGIYTLPEISTVGLDEAAARARHGEVTVGRARFHELARAQISGNVEGLLKLVADGEGRRLLGVQIVGEGATELVHIGQAAIVDGWTVERLLENVFNFPTMAEAYRAAALDLSSRLSTPPLPV